MFVIFMRHIFMSSLNFFNLSEFSELEQEYTCIRLAKGSFQAGDILPEKKQKMDLELEHIPVLSKPTHFHLVVIENVLYVRHGARCGI